MCSILSVRFVKNVYRSINSVGCRVNSSTIKDKLLKHITNLRAHSDGKGKHMLLVFKNYIGVGIKNACNYADESEAVNLGKSYTDC